MATEKGFIEYEFTQRGANSVVREMQRVETQTDDLTKSFIEYEKQVRGVSNTEKDMARASKSLTQATGVATQGQKDLGNSTKQSRDQMLSGRYALYDLASTYAIIGAALSGVGVYALTVGAQFESAFTSVERTMDNLGDTEGIANLRSELVQLSGQIPLTFAELAKIATIGNQMNIPLNTMEDFTGVMARFSAISGMTADSVAKAFGEVQNLSGLDPKYFENLASAILDVGLKSQASEANILAVMSEITSLTTRMGFAIDETVGLAGAMAALGIAPEQARGSLTLYKNALTRALSDGGDAMNSFAQITGLTAEKLDELVRTGQGAEVLTKFIEGMSKSSDIVATQQALDSIGLSSRIASEGIGKLSGDTALLVSQMQTAKESFIQGSSLNERYALTMNDLNSQWIIFINGLNALVATISGGAIPSVAGLLMGVNKLIFGFVELLERHPWVSKLLAIGGAIVTVVGVMAIMRGASFALRGSMLAYLFVAQQTGVANMGLFGTLRAVTGALAATGVTAQKASIGLRIFRGALMSTGVGLAIAGIGWLGSKLLEAGDGASDATLSMDKYNKAMEELNSANDGGTDSSANLADSLGGGGSGGSPSVADAAKEATKEIRTLIDYAQDLSGVFSRSVELRFSSGAAMDDITLKWIELNEQMQEYQRTIRTLTADRSLKAYWLSIAEAYGDQLRAGQLREGIAKIDDDLATANAGASRELVGNSRAAIENRTVMRDLVGQYEQYLVALAKSGASQQVIQQEIARLNTDFSEQATAIGYNVGEIGLYGAAFEGFNRIVALVPRDITIGFNPDPAQQALNEFFAKAKADAALAGTGSGNGFGDGFTNAINTQDPLPNAIETQSERARPKTRNNARSIGQIWATQFGLGVNAANSSIAIHSGRAGALRLGSSTGNPAYGQGGYTGPGHWQAPAGIVHRGEYVIPKKYVDQRTGTPNMDYVASIAKGQKASRGVGYAGGGIVGGAQPVRVVGGMLDLGARSMNTLSNMGGSSFSVGDRAIANAASSGFRSSSMIGAA